MGVKERMEKGKMYWRNICLFFFLKRWVVEGIKRVLYKVVFDKISDIGRVMVFGIMRIE